MIGKADVEAATGRIMDIAHQPVMALAASVRKIAATHRLGIFTKTARNIGGGTGHAGAPSGGLATLTTLNRKPTEEPRKHTAASSPCHQVALRFHTVKLGTHTPRFT